MLNNFFYSNIIINITIQICEALDNKWTAVQAISLEVERKYLQMQPNSPKMIYAPTQHLLLSIQSLEIHLPLTRDQTVCLK